MAHILLLGDNQNSRAPTIHNAAQISLIRAELNVLFVAAVGAGRRSLRCEGSPRMAFSCHPPHSKYLGGNTANRARHGRDSDRGVRSRALF